MKTTVHQAIEDELAYAERIRERAMKAAEALAPLADLQADAVSVWTGSSPIEILLGLEPVNAGEAPDLVRRVLGRLGARKASKVFNSTTGALDYIVHANDRRIIVRSVPTRCKVKLVEEKIEIPASASRVEIRKKYVIENPEECGATQGEVTHEQLAQEVGAL